jgi:hypothetical protein
MKMLDVLVQLFVGVAGMFLVGLFLVALFAALALLAREL